MYESIHEKKKTLFHTQTQKRLAKVNTKLPEDKTGIWVLVKENFGLPVLTDFHNDTITCVIKKIKEF